MALKIGELFATLVLNNEDFKAKLNDAQKGAYDFGSQMQKVGAGMTAGVTLPLVAFGAKAVQIFAEQEQAEAALAQSMGVTGAAAEKALGPMKEFASSIQAQTLYGDEAILKGMALASNMGVQKDQLKDTAKAAAGLSAAYGLDLQTAFQLLGKAAAGNTAALGRYGIIVDENASKEEKFQQILALGVGKYGAAEAAANTATGKMEQMRMAIGDMVESIGAAIAPALVPLANSIKGIANAIGALPAPARTAIVVFGAIAAAIGPLLMVVGTLIKSFLLIQSIAPAIGTAWTVAMGPVGWVIAAIAAVAAGAYLIVKNWSSIKDFFKTLWDGVKNSFKGAWDWIVGRIKALARFLSFGRIGGEVDVPEPAAASAAAGGGGGSLRVASAGAGGQSNAEMLKELKRISRNTEQRSYA